SASRSSVSGPPKSRPSWSALAYTAGVQPGHETSTSPPTNPEATALPELGTVKIGSTKPESREKYVHVERGSHGSGTSSSRPSRLSPNGEGSTRPRPGYTLVPQAFTMPLPSM